MIRRTGFAICCPLMLLVASCRGQQVSCTPSELEARDRGWAAAAFGQDLDALMSFYHERGTQLAPGGAVIAGWDQLRELFNDLFADPDYSLNWALETAEVSASCDLGYTRGDWTIISRNAAGSVTESTGKYLGVWVRDSAGSWVVLEDIFNHGSTRTLE